ncbi:UNVERIFIED_ORG: hypothetical protein J2W38_007102 [Variovorax paradoxus]|jgi:hypothetical protein|nr:hypothetical protein [Variovorax paradoxus]
MSKPPPVTHSKHEEPEVTQEESIPSDGRDIEGERLMKEVANRKLHDRGEPEHKTPEKADMQSDKHPERRTGKQDQD